MTEVEDIETRIRDLPPQDFASLREWFHQFENECWDQQIALDYKAGKFNKLVDKAREELDWRSCRL
ncbi:MAG: hypothetical protein NTX45_11320 [Proteobacteria bacterium]|nr:hypothetical protein [Pseudomonadota bacterium]